MLFKFIQIKINQEKMCLNTGKILINFHSDICRYFPILEIYSSKDFYLTTKLQK